MPDAESSSLPGVTDEALFSRLSGGDAEAFAAFYDRYEGLWYSLALRILGDVAEAEDVLQESAILIWERAPRYDPSQGRPVSWTVAVVRNRAIDRLRASRRRGGLLEKVIEQTPDSTFMTGAWESHPGEGEIGLLVRRALRGLPPEQRQAIEMAYFGGWSQSEIADRLGQPLGTVKARIRRGMLAMRDALEGAL